MNINILHYSLFSIAGSQEVNYTFVKFIFIWFIEVLLENWMVLGQCLL